MGTVLNSEFKTVRVPTPGTPNNAENERVSMLRGIVIPVNIDID